MTNEDVARVGLGGAEFRLAGHLQLGGYRSMHTGYSRSTCAYHFLRIECYVYSIRIVPSQPLVLGPDGSFRR